MNYPFAGAYESSRALAIKLFPLGTGFRLLNKNIIFLYDWSITSCDTRTNLQNKPIFGAGFWYIDFKCTLSALHIANKCVVGRSKVK